MSLISRFFKQVNDRSGYQIADAYAGLRKMIFNTTPDQIGLKDSDFSGGVWGVVLDSGYDKAVATLVAIADSTVSLYFSNGGGYIGMGTHEAPKEAGRCLLQAASKFTQFCDPTSVYPLPKKMESRFYLLTQKGILTAEATTDDLGNNRHPLSPLFHVAHQVITAIRLTDEKLQRKS
jgi:hypothetical protein